IKLDGLDQWLLMFWMQFDEYASGPLPFGPVAGMHVAVGDFAGRDEGQHASGVELEAPHGHPLAHHKFGQTATNVGTPLQDVVADDFAGRLVVEDDARRLLAIGARDETPVYAHLVVFADTLADVSRLTIDGDAPRNDEFFHFAPGADTRFGQDLVQLGHERFAVEILAQTLGKLGTALQIRQRQVRLAVDFGRVILACPALTFGAGRGFGAFA